MGWNNISTFQLLIIQGGAPGTGLFLYNGIGGPANPPVLAMVAPGVTKDPFDNPTNAVLNIGNFSAAHSGFDQNGIEYLSDASGTVKIVIDPARGMFFYSGTAALGNPPQLALALSGVTADTFGNAIGTSKILIQANTITESGGIFRTAAAAPLIQLDGPHNAEWIYDAAANMVAALASVSGNDGLGNTYPAGITEFVTISGTRWGVTLAQSVAAFGGTLAGLAITNLSVPWSIPASVAGLETGGGANLELSSGLQTAGGQQSAIELQDSVAAGGVTGGLVVVNAGNFTAQTPSPNPTLLQVIGSTGRVQVILPDGNTYRTERLIQRTTATQQFTLASAVAITGLSVPLGVGSYHVRLKVFWVPSGVVGSTHVHNFAFTGTATGNVNGQCWQAQAASAVQQTTLNNGTLASSLTSPTHVAFNGWTELDLFVTVSVAGTLTHTITLTTAGDDITTSPGTYWEVKPL